MNQSVHQLLQLILQGFAWVLRTIETVWVWSWAQINHAFSMSWEHLPPWKIVVGIVFIAILAAILVMLLRRIMAGFGRIAAAFWTMMMTVFAVLVVVVMAGLFSRGFQWVVASVPDRFWEKLM
jgi:hypothetical protein